MVWYQSVPSRVHGRDSVATKEVPFEKKADSKYMQVNVLRNIASVAKRDDEIPTH